MDTKGRVIWQIAAGNGDNTHYAKLCLDKDVIILGPGRYGAWPKCETAIRRDRSAMMAGIIRRFATEISPRDLVVLRVGTQEVYGVGQVVGSYDWSEKFADVQGWDLQHYRRVRWLWKADPTPKRFPSYTLKFGSSVQKMISSEVEKWINSLEPLEEAYARPLAIL